MTIKNKGDDPGGGGGEKSIIAGHLQGVRESLDLTPHQDAIIGCAIDRLNLLTERTLELSEQLIKQQSLVNRCNIPGWKLVPEELTPEMLRRIVPNMAYSEALSHDEYDYKGRNEHFVRWIWTRLLYLSSEMAPAVEEDSVEEDDRGDDEAHWDVDYD